MSKKQSVFTKKPIIISFANQKGGVGKSTLNLQTTFHLSPKAGKKVLVIDLDGQGNTSSRLVPHETTADGDKQPVYYGTPAADWFTPNLANIEVMHSPCGVDLIHTPKNHAALYELEALSLEAITIPRDNLTELVKQYDYVLIDCPPSLGRKLLAALAMSTHVVCPIKLSGFAVDGLEGLLTTLIGVQDGLNTELQIAGIVINDMVQSKSHERAYKQIQEAVPGLLFKNIIRNRPPLDTATSEGVPIWTLTYGHVAAKEVEAVIEELIEKVNAA